MGSIRGSVRSHPWIPCLRVAYVRREADLKHDETSQDLLFRRLLILCLYDRSEHCSLQAGWNDSLVVAVQNRVLDTNTIEPSGIQLYAIDLELRAIEVELDHFVWMG